MRARVGGLRTARQSFNAVLAATDASYAAEGATRPSGSRSACMHCLIPGMPQPCCSSLVRVLEEAYL